ncbi:MAG: hypothetical protein GEU99_20860 [Luteitalea sp.]|nr:hypothetical protein [Luteitalea sp.]
MSDVLTPGAGKCRAATFIAMIFATVAMAYSAAAAEQERDMSTTTVDGGGSHFPHPQLSRFWLHVSETSAVVYFRAGALNRAAQSYVEYGFDKTYGQTTPLTGEPRLAQLHRLTGLVPGTEYHFRMVLVTERGEVRSKDHTFTTEWFADAIRIPQDVEGPPYTLDQDGQRYVLTEDIVATDTAINVTGSDITLELDGHTVTFGTTSSAQVRGVFVTGGGTTTVKNGHIVQGEAAGDYSAGVEARGRTAPVEVFGITTDIHRPNGSPMRLWGTGTATEAKIHHNHFFSTVTEIASRHYPGNDLLDVDAGGPGIEIVDNLFTEGAHRAIGLSGEAPGAEVAFNDIRHHMRYTNGYALSISAGGGVDVHHNTVTSLGRGAYLSRADIQFHDNYLDLAGHMTLDDLPQDSPFQEARIAVHGIKLEGWGVTNTKVFDNYVRIIQLQPDAEWDYTPATPLNLGVYTPNAHNEIYDNTFVALTTYETTWHGDYWNNGQWAAPLYFVAMTSGPADVGEYAAYIHDNKFFSNDLFVGAQDGEVNMTVRIEDNTFILVDDPPPTVGRQRYYQIGAALEAVVENGDNTFIECDETIGGC